MHGRARHCWRATGPTYGRHHRPARVAASHWESRGAICCWRPRWLVAGSHDTAARVGADISERTDPSALADTGKSGCLAVSPCAPYVDRSHTNLDEASWCSRSPFDKSARHCCLEDTDMIRKRTAVSSLSGRSWQPSGGPHRPPRPLRPEAPGYDHPPGHPGMGERGNHRCGLWAQDLELWYTGQTEGARLCVTCSAASMTPKGEVPGTRTSSPHHLCPLPSEPAWPLLHWGACVSSGRCGMCPVAWPRQSPDPRSLSSNTSRATRAAFTAVGHPA